jgi:3-hydroxybutyrate dehydrogenase
MEQAMLEGKCAVVTGSTSGIGLEIAKALAAQGASVAFNGLSADPAAAQAICESVTKDTGAKTLFIQADLSKPAEARRLIGEAQAGLGPIDILVNNAGVQHVAPVEDFPEDKWDLILALNLSAAFHLTKQVFSGMKARKWGRIVNIASAHALVASPFKSAYVTAKHGLLGFTKTIALEGAESGVTANAICPGYVLTPLVQKQIPDTAKARGITEEAVVRDVLLAAQSTKRFIATAEIAALTVFLCSPGAASVTGTSLPIDGGWTAH